MTIMDGQSTAERARIGALGHGGLDREQLAAQYGWVHSVARNLVRDPWGAEDVTQETLLAALAAPPPDVPDDQRLRAWLGRVAFNLSRLGVRQGARRRAREVRVARAEAMPSVSDELEARATVNGLSRAIAELSEPDRRVVLMRYFDGESTAEIAARMGVSELAVRKRLWRARNKLRVALEPEHRRGRFLALWFGRPWSLRDASPASGAGWNKLLGGLAAGLALCAGATWWWGQAERAGEPGAPSLAELGPAARTALELGSAGPADPAERGLEGHTTAPTQRSWVPPLPRDPRGEVPAEEGTSVAHLEGFVLDLEGRPQPGLAVLEARASIPTSAATGPGADERPVLATTDALGRFRIPAEGLPTSGDAPLVLEARGAELATVVRARLAAAQREPGLILVAQAFDLTGSVVDEDGLVLAGARAELVCSAAAFARVEHPVQLDSAVLCAFGTDAAGRLERRGLPRAAGLSLRVACSGYEPLERATLALGREELFVLRASPAVAELSGTVYRLDGRAAGGATVRLARASTTTDVEGRFRLPLRGVRADSPLEASDKRAAPTRVPDFGSRLLAGQVAEVELVLGEEHDSVTGKLLGPSAAGWLVAAYPEQGATLDDKGRELPAGLTHSDTAGGFEFSLPSGLYSLRALAPDAVQVARRDGLDSRSGAWELELPTPVLASLGGTVHDDEGQLLASAHVAVAVLLDGAGGRRSLPWGNVETGPLGAFAFPRDPELELELSVDGSEEPVAGASESSAADGSTQSFLVGALATRAGLVVARPAWLQVARSSTAAESCSVLDADGAVLSTRGPLGKSASFELHEGWSPVLGVPPSARWLELASPGAEPVRVPIEPEPGRILTIRP